MTKMVTKLLGSMATAALVLVLVEPSTSGQAIAIGMLTAIAYYGLSI